MWPVPDVSVGAQLMVAVELPTVTVSLPGVPRLYVIVPEAVVGVPWKA
jgi:hypothetical protein